MLIKVKRVNHITTSTLHLHQQTLLHTFDIFSNFPLGLRHKDNLLKPQHFNKPYDEKHVFRQPLMGFAKQPLYQLITVGCQWSIFLARYSYCGTIYIRMTSNAECEYPCYLIILYTCDYTSR